MRRGHGATLLSIPRLGHLAGRSGQAVVCHHLTVVLRTARGGADYRAFVRVGPLPPRTMRVTARSAALGVGIVVAAIIAQRIFVAAHRPLSWAAAAVVVAVMIDPIVDVLDRRLPRIASVLIALLVLGVATWAVIYVAFDDLARAVDRVSDVAEDAAKELEDRQDSVGQTARDAEAARRVHDFVTAVNDRVAGGDEVLRSTANVAPTYFLGGILTLFLMSYGPRIARSAVEQLPDENVRVALSDMTIRAVQRARRAVLLTLAEGLVIGLAVTAAARLLSLPGAAALGLAAGVMSLLPHVGLVLGGVPLVLLVLALRSDTEAVIVAAVLVAAQLADSYWLRRKVSASSVHVGLLVPWVVALIGYAIYGVGGAFYGVILIVFVLAAVDELSRRSQIAPTPEATQDAATVETTQIAPIAEATSG
jgi:predicted PurR-regulated permease PerM